MRPEVGCEHAGHDLDQRRLAGAVVADQPDDLVPPDGEVDVAQRVDGAEIFLHALEPHDLFPVARGIRRRRRLGTHRQGEVRSAREIGCMVDLPPNHGPARPSPVRRRFGRVRPAAVFRIAGRCKGEVAVRQSGLPLPSGMQGAPVCPGRDQRTLGAPPASRADGFKAPRFRLEVRARGRTGRWTTKAGSGGEPWGGDRRDAGGGLRAARPGQGRRRRRLYPRARQGRSRQFGIALATVDGEIYAAGDADHLFTIQSVSKPFMYGYALQHYGRDYVLRHVGVEPTGEAFNSIVLDEAPTGRSTPWSMPAPSPSPR